MQVFHHFELNIIMNSQSHKEWFNGLESIIDEPLKFKAKLSIGEEAYASLRLKNHLLEVWDVAGIAGTAATIAKSSFIASRFFAPSGFLAVIGIGSSATTPVGWVIAASVVTSGAWFGITRYFKDGTADRVTVIP